MYIAKYDSGTSHEEYMLKTLRAKAFDYILKPICMDDIAGVVQNSSKVLKTRLR